VGLGTFIQRGIRRVAGLGDMPYGTGDGDNLYEIALADFLGSLPDHVAVNERNALQIGTVDSAHSTIAGTLGRLTPYARQGGSRVPQAQGPALLRNHSLERGVPRSTTLRQTFGAMFFQPHTWWHVLKRDFYGWPEWIEWVPRHKAGLDSDGRLIKVGSKPVENPDLDVIRFDSPLGNGFLYNAAKDIRRALAINLAAAKAEDSPIPAIELHDELGVNLPPEKVDDLLDKWADARRRRGVAFTPKGLKVIAHGKPADALLIDGRRAINIELVRHSHLPAWAVQNAVEGATMTYDNRGLRNWELMDLGLSSYVTAFNDRLSMPDVTPRGWEIVLDTDEFTRDDMQTRFSTYRTGLGDDTAFIDLDWIKEREGWTTTAPKENA
jgi:hypothetical protein